MYTSKYWWEVIGEEGNYIRFRHKGHYIRVHDDKVWLTDEFGVGYLAKIIKQQDSDTIMVIYPPDYDCIKLNPEAIKHNAFNRWRKLMGR